MMVQLLFHVHKCSCGHEVDYHTLMQQECSNSWGAACLHVQGRWCISKCSEYDQNAGGGSRAARAGCEARAHTFCGGEGTDRRWKQRTTLHIRHHAPKIMSMRQPMVTSAS